MPEFAENLPNPAIDCLNGALNRFQHALQSYLAEAGVRFPIKITWPQPAQLLRSVYSAATLRLRASRLGGMPNIREYSRLNCDGLS